MQPPGLALKLPRRNYGFLSGLASSKQRAANQSPRPAHYIGPAGSCVDGAMHHKAAPEVNAAMNQLSNAWPPPHVCRVCNFDHHAARSIAKEALA